MLIRKRLYLMSDDGGASGANDGGGSSGAGDAGASDGGGNDGGGDQGGKPDDGKTFTQADVERIIAGRLSKYADYDDLKKQVDEAKAANQTEHEKAVNAARDEGRSEAASEAAQALAREAFDNLAGRRNPDFDTDKALRFLNLGQFVKDGQLDRDALKEAVAELVPEKGDARPAPSFGGGVRPAGDKPEPGPGVPRLRNAYASSNQ